MAFGPTSIYSAPNLQVNVCFDSGLKSVEQAYVF